MSLMRLFEAEMRSDAFQLLGMSEMECSMLYLLQGLESTTAPSFGNETDRLALLDFKDGIKQDPLQIMSLWNDSVHFCNWVGVTCSPSNGRVMIMNLESQSLVGSISPSIGNLTFLTGFNLKNNSFHGEIPRDLGRLLHLQYLNLSSNYFVGKIPTNLSHCTDLRVLDANFNELVGPIPDQLSSLTKLLYLRIAVNNLTGSIPAWIGNFSLLLALSLAWNNLHGSIPHELGHLSNLRFFQLYGNELSGSFGSVYKGVLYDDDDEAIVAVKVLNLQQQGASQSFMDECKALKSIRHRNLLKIITVCSSVDHQGNDFKGLVFEFMSNGNLDQWLHPRDNGQCHTKSLNIIQRLNIAIDVASAMDYLHHHCQTTIVHCDLKPSNVLLDDDMTAHVGDFGLAKFLFDASNNPFNNQTISAGLKGSIGYIPPEYGMGGQVSTLGDVFSYGILLLEMFTGKRPTDEIFKDGLTIHKFALSENVMDIVDSSLLLVEEEEEEDDVDENEVEEIAIIHNDDPQRISRSAREDCLVSVMRIGLSCCTSLPKERMAMNVVVNKMLAVRDTLLDLKKRNQRIIK